MKKEEYDKLYKESLKNPEDFWSKQATSYLDWISMWDGVSESNFKKGQVSWFKGAKINASINCIDRHLKKRANQTAIIWEGDDPKESKKISYKELYIEVCKFSNALKNLGIKKGDVITIYMPMIPEAAIAMLSCARIGAIHSVVFGGFSADSLADRINDCNSSLIITADYGIRGGKKIPLKEKICY